MGVVDDLIAAGKTLVTGGRVATMRVTMLNKYYSRTSAASSITCATSPRAWCADGDRSRRARRQRGPEHVDRRRRRRRGRRGFARSFAYASTPVAPSMRARDRRRGIAHRATRHRPPALAVSVGRGLVAAARHATLPTVLTYHSDIVRQRVLGTAYRPILERVLDSRRPDRRRLAQHGRAQRVARSACRQVPRRAVRHRRRPLRRHARACSRAPRSCAPATSVRSCCSSAGSSTTRVPTCSSRRWPTSTPTSVMIGSGPLEGELRERVFALGMTDRVTFLPPQPDEDLAAWYHAADVFCLPSVARSEAFGLVQIEAHASGTPAISTDLTTGVPFANLDGVTGLTVPVGDVDALARALDEHRSATTSCARALAGRRASARTTEFTIPRMVADMRRRLRRSDREARLVRRGPVHSAVAPPRRRASSTSASSLAFLMRFGGELPAFNFDAYLGLAPIITRHLPGLRLHLRSLRAGAHRDPVGDRARDASPRSRSAPPHRRACSSSAGFDSCRSPVSSSSSAGSCTCSCWSRGACSSCASRRSPGPSSAC